MHGAVAALRLYLASLITGPCTCFQIYDPVACANGETYANQCLAECADAKECKLVYDGKSNFRASTLFG